MRRRELITLLGGFAAWPIAASAQQANKATRVGFLPLGSQSNAYDRFIVETFRQAIAETGLTENRDIIIDVVWITRDPEAAVRELIQRGTDLLVPCGSSASVAARRQTRTIPIVFINVGNPIGIGLVESLSHPGGNATGFSDALADLSAKYVEIARDLTPTQAIVGYLWYTHWPDGENRYHATERAARSLGVKLVSRGVGDASDMNDAMMAVKESGARVVIVQPSPFMRRQISHIIDLATARGLGTIYGLPQTAREGGLAAYGPDTPHMYRRAAHYVHQVLKGAKPAELPVQQPTKFELVINLKSAKALGLTVPSTLLARADEVIE
jgi:putative ABC transport system substrate-binding protein